MNLDKKLEILEMAVKMNKDDYNNEIENLDLIKELNEVNKENHHLTKNNKTVRF